jgi:hypothetical protein
MGRRTTLTLEDDVTARIDAEARRSGKPVKTVVNEALRAGLEQRAQRPRIPFRVRARPMGLRPDVELDDVEGLLDRLEGSDHR